MRVLSSPSSRGVKELNIGAIKRVNKGNFLMAKKSSIAREKRRIIAVERSEAKRQTLRKAILSETDYDLREKLVGKLNAMPRDSSRIRIRRRCVCCGRPRAVYRRFAMCRLCLRNLVLMGMVPGIRKASW